MLWDCEVVFSKGKNEKGVSFFADMLYNKQSFNLLLDIPSIATTLFLFSSKCVRESICHND